jgi:hypothetical protein
MPRDGSDIYHMPPGTLGIPDTTIESNKYNAFALDIQQEANTPRPVVAGGTGASNPNDALFSITGEKSSQVVTNYDSHVWLPGSFYSDLSATNAPVAAHAFVGWVVSSDAPANPPSNLNVVVHARDQTGTTVPGRVYIREKKAGVWGPWSIDGTGMVSATPPANPPDNALWWNSSDGTLYVYYNDGNSKQWVIACPQPDEKKFLLKAGDNMGGVLGLFAPPVADLDAANKKYVDDKVQAGVGSIITFDPGTVMVFYQSAAPTGWTKRTDINDVGLRVVSGSVAAHTSGAAWSAVFAPHQDSDYALTLADIPLHAHGVLINDPGHGHTGSAPFHSDLSGVPSGGSTEAGGNTPITINPNTTGVRVWDGSTFDTTKGVGGGGAHHHSFDLSINYIDVILATKN